MTGTKNVDSGKWMGEPTRSKRKSSEELLIPNYLSIVTALDFYRNFFLFQTLSGRFAGQARLVTSL
jgi:hypothetical protein